MFNRSKFNKLYFNRLTSLQYSSNIDIEVERVQIFDILGNRVAVLSPESDGLKECWLDNELNGSCTLKFTLPLDSEKWAYLTSEYRIRAEGKEFVILTPDSVQETRKGKKKHGKVTASESWTLLRKDFVTASNDPQNPSPPWGTVIILSGGDTISNYAPGSAGNALSYLLQDSEWSVDMVDVDGTFDLETDKENLLTNIKKVQELWGGYLVWDSINKTVSLRDESSWQNYNGFQIRYAKNLKHIERTIDNDITTRLYPFGEDDLDISSVNNGQLYIENFQYTSEILKDKYENQDITDPQQLKDKAIKELDKLSKPRYNYRTGLIDVRELPEYNHENFSLGDMVDVIDDDLDFNIYIRIIRHKYNIFQPCKCELEIGDPMEKIETRLNDSKRAADYIERNLKPNSGLGNLLKGIINTLATEVNGSNGDFTLVDGVATWYERDSEGNLTGNITRVTPNGLIISSDGGQTWETAVSGAGIAANLVATGLLSASVVQVGADSTFESNYDPSAKETPEGAQSKVDTHDANQSPHNLPSYTRMEPDGFKVYDDQDVLRCILGQFDGMYGAKIIRGILESPEIQLLGGNGEIKFESGGYFRSPEIVYDCGSLGMCKIFHWWYGAGGEPPTLYFQNFQVIEFQDRYPILKYITQIYGNRDTNDLTFKNTSVTIEGSLDVEGSTKNAVEQTDSYGKRRLSVRESPEIKYTDEGITQLNNGQCQIDLDPIFLECIEPNTTETPWLIHLTPYGDFNIYIAEIGIDYFIVKEQNEGTGNGIFTWSFSATRKGYAGIRLQEVLEDEDREA